MYNVYIMYCVKNALLYKVHNRQKAEIEFFQHIYVTIFSQTNGCF